MPPDDALHIEIPETRRAEHRRWLSELTSLPTAAGREGRVVEWVEAWIRARAGLRLQRDDAGNMTIRFESGAQAGGAPIYFTAHLDHPAFVVEGAVGPHALECSFRGGVMACYFKHARVRVHLRDGRSLGATVVEHEPAAPPARIFPRCLLELDDDATTDAVAIGDVATWDLPATRIEADQVLAPACDDLAALAAALAALDILLDDPAPKPDVRVLLTVAEEVGFIGAIAACRLGTIPNDARIIALENSRSMADSPIGAGPIVRVGDRLSTFSPTLTGAIAKVAQRLGGVPEKKVGDPSVAPEPAFQWQRKLMPGGACEATAYSAYGHDATCVCLPLGNYHNMGDLDRVQEEAKSKGDAGAIDAPIAPERISLRDYEGLVTLLVGCGRALEGAEPLVDRMEKLYAERSFVLGIAAMEEGSR
ncbi:MAG: M20/M25/M40 family metallo-hydrolase [Phycisphaerales bacterium]